MRLRKNEDDERRKKAEAAMRAKAAKAKKTAAKKKALLLGLGLDCKDGHVRVTRGPNFHLMGGSEDTHAAMQEKAVKFNEALRKKGKCLEDLSVPEFIDLAHKAKFHEK